MENDSNSNSNSNDKDVFDEPALEDFLFDEELSEKDIRRKKRRAAWLRTGAILLALVFFINGLAVWTNVINIPALEFVKTSYRLSKKESIQAAKQAVVTVQGDGYKGTGFNISENGRIITNSHVIEKMNTITVYFPTGKVFRAEVIQNSPKLDIAILDVKGDHLPTLKLQQTQKWKKGDHIYVIGNPLSYTQIANEGEIEDLVLINERTTPVLQISAPIYRGNSGSPVLTEKNEVIGLVYATTIPKLRSKEKASGLAVPIDEVKALLEQID